ncbi:hypothetical protein V7S43_018631 [Phytophthora oleae]|uniref:Ankyrin repeat-containing domain n=1 Tax=Phytophthora oleae TaxID=2107226 RepID=A0ABD3ETQ9_9STRA
MYFFSSIHCPKRRRQLGSTLQLASAFCQFVRPGELLIDARPSSGALKHVTAAVSSFLDYSACWSITSACARGAAAPIGDEISLRLLDRIAAHRATSAVRHPFAAKQQSDECYRQWEFTRDTAASAARGDLRALKWLVDLFPHCRVTIAVEEAAINGQLHVLEWLLEKSRRQELTVFWGARELFFAGKHGHLHVAQWLHEHTAPPPTHMFFVTLEEAARNGELELVRWLCEVRGEWSPYAAVLAASGGHLQVLEWLRTNLFSSSSSAISMDDTAAGGHLDVLRWLQSHSGYATPGAMNKAAASGHLEVVKWLHGNRREGCTNDAMNLAATAGHLDIVQWLHENRDEGCTTDAMDGAAKHGHLDIVLWLHGNRTEGCTERAIDRAAANGHLTVVQWLHGNRSEGCTTAAMDGAARSNHLETVQWLNENRSEGCTITAMNLAARSGHLAVVT